MTGARPTIFIAMPLFEGWEHVAHTLKTIQQQTFRDYRVVISVDGGDWRSYEACLPFVLDSRFQVVLHQARLGWSGNMNYLASVFDGDYFCYWQHDDYCDPRYLELLLEHAVDHPEASATYCDMQNFGEIDVILRQPSSTGFQLERLLREVNRPTIAAIRCLIRADALRASLPITLGAMWALSLARAGELHRVPHLLYFRRIRPRALTFTMLEEPPTVKWRTTLDWSLAVLEAIHPLVCDHERTKLFAMIADLVTRDKTTISMKYKFQEGSHNLKVKFVREFIDEARSRHGWGPFAEIGRSYDETILRARAETGKLADGEALLIEALLTHDFLPDAAISEHAPT